jgi:hypothetical protein
VADAREAAGPEMTRLAAELQEKNRDFVQDAFRQEGVDCQVRAHEVRQSYNLLKVHAKRL